MLRLQPGPIVISSEREDGELEPHLWILCGISLTLAGGASPQDGRGSDCIKRFQAGRTAADTGRFGDAEKLYSQVIPACEKSGLPDQEVAAALANFALAKMFLGNQADAADLFRRAIVLMERQPDAHTKELITLWHALGSSLYYQHLYALADHSYNRALGLTRLAPQKDPLMLADLLLSLGAVYSAQRRYSDTETVLEQARDILESNGGADPVRRTGLLVNLGALYHEEHRSDDALAAFTQALQMLETGDAGDALMTVHVLNNLAIEYMDRNNYKAAGGFLSRAVDLVESGTPLSKFDVGKVLDNYRLCLRRTGSPKQDRDFERRKRTIMSAIPPQAAGGALTIDVHQLGRAR